MTAKAELSWLDLEGTVTQEVLHAPKTGGDPLEDWPGVHSRIAQYLARNVTGTPWMDHLALIAAVVSAKRYDVASVKAIDGDVTCASESALPAARPGEDTGMGHRDLLPILPQRRDFPGR